MSEPRRIPSDALAERAAAGDKEALGALLHGWREDLRRLVARRLDPRLAGRVDASDVVQSACLEAVRRLPEFDGSLPLTLWVRLIAKQEAAEAHRRHLGAAARDVRRETAPPASVTGSGLADDFVASATSPLDGAAREETRRRLAAALDRLEPHDREIVALRHFERLDNQSAARELGIEPSAASKRYLRALTRLKAALGGDAARFGVAG